MTKTHLMSTAELAGLLRAETHSVYVRRDTDFAEIAALLDAGLIVEVNADATTPDRRYEVTDYGRDVVWGCV